MHAGRRFRWPLPTLSSSSWHCICRLAYLWCVQLSKKHDGLGFLNIDRCLPYAIHAVRDERWRKVPDAGARTAGKQLPVLKWNYCFWRCASCRHVPGVGN